jgi:flagellar biosynthesis protein FlhF
MMNPDLLNLYAKLIRSGVNEDFAKSFFDKTGFLNHYSTADDGIVGRVIKEVMKVIRVTRPFDVKDKVQIVAALIGTTGVGKTTTIAKLAAHLMLKSRKKVGLISIDTYRIGAMEQLKTYANILGMPCLQAFSRKDVLSVLKRMEGKDIVLIDTAGQSQYDGARIEELKRMVEGNSTIQTHLLLSAGTTETEMNRTAVNFGPLNYRSYIFTKIDETERCGSLLNQTMKLNLPISYITNGQNVPEDIEQAEKRRIMNRILNNHKSVFHRSR